MIYSMTFGQKLGLGFALVVLLAGVTAAVGYFTVDVVIESKDRVIMRTDEDLIDIESLRARLHKAAASARGFLLSANPEFADATAEANAEFEEIWQRVHKRATTAEAKARLDEIHAQKSAYMKVVRLAMQSRAQDADLPRLAATMDNQLAPSFEALAKSVRQLSQQLREQREKDQLEAAHAVERAHWMLLLALGCTMLLAVGAGSRLTTALASQVGASVQHIRSSSSELQTAATQQASGAKEQATAMSEITTTISELLATSRQIAESAQHVARMATDSAQSTREGEAAVKRAREAVGSIQGQVDIIVQHMLELGRKSQQIGSILEIINELADQTNILAINATIEAAGAGEAGRRFSVVGEEIRKLADRVGTSTKEIRTLIEEVRAAVNASVMATESGSKTVTSGVERFEELQSAFTRIGGIIYSTMEAGREIELSTKQQTSAVEQVNVAIASVAQASKETQASSGQTLQTASQLASLSGELARLIRQEPA